jgi:DNA-binding transcriptional LysR family regulator
MNVSTRQLRAFVALAEQRSFTRAAALSHLSQPAFSALIRSLEEALALRLFDRSTRHVALTTEGRAFEVSARRVLAEFEAALGSAADYAARRRGKVAIALLPSLAAGWLPGVLVAFRAAFPAIELEVADVLSEGCIERVKNGQADFAIAAIRADTPELRAELFCTDRFHLVCPAGHPLLQTRTAPRPKDLLPYPFIHLSRTSSVRQYLDAALRPLQLNTLLEVEQLATVTGLVRAGLGISIVPALTLFHFEQPGLATRPLGWKGLARRLYLVQRRDRGLSLAAQALHEMVLTRPPAIEGQAPLSRGSTAASRSLSGSAASPRP